MKLRSYPFLFVIFCLLTFTASAQTGGWQYLPNAGLISPGRFEDVYFLDTNVGFAVAIIGPGISNAEKPIYRTTNGGNTWTLIGPAIHGSTALRSIEFLSDRTTAIVGSLNGYIYHTTNGGGTWIDISSSISDTVVTDTVMAGRKNICGLAHYGNNFYGVGWWGSSVGRFYKSTDKGLTWTTTYIDTNLATGLVDAVFLSQDTGFITGGRNRDAGAFSSPSDESVILKTCDGGVTWTKVFSDTTLGGRIWKIQMLDRMNFVGAIEPYYYPDSVNMVKSTDGGNTWQIIAAGHIHDTTGASGGFPGSITQGVGFVNKRTGWLGGYYVGLFETNDGGATWAYSTFGSTFNRMYVVDSEHVFAGGLSVYKWTPLHGTANVQQPEPLKPPHILKEIAPNPANGMVNIEFDLSRPTNVLLQVVNVGMRRHSTLASDRLPAGHHTYKWDGTNMPVGNYLVWLGTDEIPLIRKFVLVK